MKFELFDARHYETLPVTDGYRIWAETYDASLGDHLDLHLLARTEVVSWACIGTVADLACGTGRIGTWLGARGVPRVDGIDVSLEMLSRAREKGTYRALVRADMRLVPLRSGSYDLVTSSLAVEHVPSLLPVYAEAARLASESGLFALASYHPHFLLNGIPTHFETPEGRHFAIENAVHLLRDHVAAARRTGWTLLDLDERVVDEAWIEEEPSFAKYAHRPVSFLAVWKRTG